MPIVAMLSLAQFRMDWVSFLCSISFFMPHFQVVFLDKLAMVV